ncbi:hypothetical protein [[Mycobacterium] nativiensis]|uniref:DUF4190 domain-containing protein n=1 Tax=[Mycobacterium] nativiensis TaxID=2855503 RepID=A0ABU5XX57_9MYCO|nr:hypothetical protein [Mycolicibacter sp. MYC340]MEB3032574.1 hypothetical protein [Mycolicibacter sp. MYC340]
MPAAILARIRDGDPAFWKSATRSAPIVAQVVLAAIIGVGWLGLNGCSFCFGTVFWYLVAAAIIVPAAAGLAVGPMLLRAESPRRRGVGLAVAGLAVLMVVSGLFYALIFLPWFENT